MLASLRAEILKMRRLRLWLVAAGVGVALAVLIWLSVTSALARFLSERHAETPWQNQVIGDATVMVVLALPTLVVIVTALVFYVEHRNQMWKQLRATPRSMLSIYAAKFVVVQAVVALSIGVLLATALVAWAMSPDDIRAALAVSDADVRRTLSLVALELYVSLLPAALLQFALSARTSNVLHAVGIGVALTIACLLLAGPFGAAWFPYAYPGAVVMANFATPGEAGPGGEQTTDTAYRAPEGALAGAAPAGAVILVDEAHQNRHGLGSAEAPGTLRWIAAPAEAARIAVERAGAPVGPETLARATLLVVAGVPSDTVSEAEVRAIVEWVRGGGSLLLLTDHEPFGRPVLPLAEALGVGFTLDVVADPHAGDPRAPGAARLVFTRAEGLVGDHPITEGVDRVVTYGGQGVWREAEGSVALLRLPGSPRVAQLVAFQFGRGRVVVSGETALFTAQRHGDSAPIGVGDPETDNGRLATNTLRWLLGRESR